MQDYTREQLWGIFEKLPEKLKELIFSEKTAETINAVCERCNIESEKTSEIARYTGRVLMKRYLASDLQTILKEEMSISPEAAQEIYQEIYKKIFYPVKNLLREETTLKDDSLEDEPEQKTETYKDTGNSGDSYRESV